MHESSTKRLLFPLAAVVAVTVWAACKAGTASSEFSGPEATDSGSTIGTDAGTFIAFGSPDSGGAGTGAIGSTPFDPGPLVLVDGGVQCFAGGEVEHEPNDTKDTASVLRPIRCGEIAAPGGESDWLSFEIDDASTTGFRIYYEGQVHVVVETAGMPPTDISRPDQPLVFVKRQPYYIELRSIDGRSQPWRVALHEESSK